MTTNTPNLAQQLCYWPAPSLFGLRSLKLTKVLGWKQGAHPLQGEVPAVNPNYKFSTGFVTDLALFLQSPDGDGLYIHGPTGSGKTSGVLQVAARLHWPVVEVNCNSTMEVCDLIGAFQLISEPAPDGTVLAPAMRFVYGPLAKAMKYGCILLLNEIDTLDPSQAVGLNSVLEGQPLTVVQNGGEVIKPHPMFRIIATANSNGRGDASGQYLGTGRQNLAFMDRFRSTTVDYVDSRVELGILTAVTAAGGGLPADLLQKMVKFANDIRKNFVGGQEECRVESPVSTRSLIRWATLMQRYHGLVSEPLKTAFQKAIVDRSSDRDKTVLNQMFKSIFGVDNN